MKCVYDVCMMLFREKDDIFIKEQIQTGAYYILFITIVCVFCFYISYKIFFSMEQHPMDVQEINYSRLMLRKYDFNPDTYFFFNAVFRSGVAKMQLI